MIPISFQKDRVFSFRPSRLYARNYPNTPDTPNGIYAVGVYFGVPIVRGQLTQFVPLSRNRSLIYNMLTKLVSTPYPVFTGEGDPSGFNMINFSVSVQLNNNAEIANTTYTQLAISGGSANIAYGVLVDEDHNNTNEFTYARTRFQLKFLLSDPHIQTISMAKFRIGLPGKKFPVCVSSRINGADACERPRLLAPEMVADEWEHSGTGFEALPVRPDLSSIAVNWDGHRRVDIHPSLPFNIENPDPMAGDWGTAGCCDITPL